MLCRQMAVLYTLLVLAGLVAGQQGMEPAAAPGMAPAEVRTAQELQAAIEGGAEHIIVKEHLDTRNLHPTSPSYRNTQIGIMFWLQEGTRFIQVCMPPHRS